MQSQLHPLPKKAISWYTDSLFITLIVGLLFFLFLGDRPLFVPDEGRYAEISREMLSLKDFVTPHLNGIKYFEKPALFYWLGAFFLKIGGHNLLAIRSINALLGILGALLTYITARTLYDRRTGLFSAAILVTSALYFVMSHTVSLDLPVTVFLSATLYCFLLSQRSDQNHHKWLLGAATFAGLAVLTKGLIGLLFPSIIIFAWILLLGNWRVFTRLHLTTCIPLFLLITVPWHLLVGLRNPEFFYFYFIEQHFLRYTTTYVGHYQPAWFFIPVLLAGFFPWSIFLLQSIFFNMPRKWEQRQSYQNELFFILWIVLIFIFFSFSKSKLIPYILPIFPALSILTARYLNSIKQAGSLVSYGFLIIFTCAIAWELYSLAHYGLVADTLLAIHYLNFAAGVLAIGILLAFYLRLRKKQISSYVIAITSGIFLITLTAAAPYLDTRSVLPLAKTLQHIIQPNDEVVTYNQYYQDLPFYLEKRVCILNWSNELSFGKAHQDATDWMINNQIFWKRWNSSKRIFAIISQEEFNDLAKKYPKENIYLIDKTKTTLLISNMTHVA